MRTQQTTLMDLGNEKTLRCDVDYIKYHQTHVAHYDTFNDLFSIISGEGYQEDELIGDFEYCEIGHCDKNGEISPVTLNFDRRALEDESYYVKIEKGDVLSVELEDILIAKVRPNLKKTIRITQDKLGVYYTTAFIRLKAKEMPDLLYYCLRTIFYEDLMAIARQGKGYPTINEKDLVTLRFNGSVINQLRVKYADISLLIKDVETRIHTAQETIQSSQSIIDSVFQREFGFDYDTFEMLKSQKHYSTQLSMFSNNPDLRFSAKYHRPAGEFVMKQLTEITDSKIKHLITEPIVLGASVSPKDYDEAGEYAYISMATIKCWSFDAEAASTVSNSYSAQKPTKTVQKHDIILARSGEGTIGKVAMITDQNLQGIFADFTMRIRLNEKRYHPTFAYYFMRSRYFQYLVEVYKKGLGNNTNIFPIVIQEFPIPDTSLKNQQRIVDEIQTEIKKQEEIQAEIAKLRAQIEEIIIQSITETDCALGFTMGRKDRRASDDDGGCTP